MMKKTTKIALLLIAAVMLIGIAFAGAASADPKIEITNKTNTYEINLANPIVYGDNPVTDGSVTYTEEDGMPVLTLHAFKASTTTNLPVIFANSDVLDLKIVLDGISTLNSSKDGTANSALYLEFNNDKDKGNLTITTIPGTPGKLIVNQTIGEGANPIYVNSLIKIEGVDTTLETNAKSKDTAYSIISNKGIEIDGATVTAIADAASSSAEGLKTDYIRITNSAHVKVTATASGTVSGLYAQGTDGIAIDGGSEVNVYAKSSAGEAYGLRSKLGQISITNAETVNVNAISGSNTNAAYALYAKNNIDLTSSHFKATADAESDAYVMYTSSTDGDISIADSTIDELTATSKSGKTYPIKVDNGDLSITDSTHIGKVISHAGDNKNANGFWVKNCITITDSTIGEMNSTSASGSSYVMYTAAGDISITDSTIDELTATSNSGGTYPIYVDDGDLLITDSTHIGKVISHTGDSGYANGFWVNNCITITDSTIDEMNSTSDSGEAYVMYTSSTDGDISITDSTIGELTATSDSGMLSALYASSGKISITDSTIDELTATSNSGYIYLIDPCSGDLSITNSTIDGLTATSKSGKTYPIYVDDGDLLITDSTHIGKVISHAGGSKNANGFWVNMCITITDSTIGEMNSTSASGSSYVMYTAAGDISITDSTIDELTATSNSGGTYPISVYNGDLSITDSTHIGKVISHTGDFGYANGFWVNMCITITDSTIGEMNSTSASGGSYVMYTSSEDGDISITDSTIDEVTATSNSGESYAISTWDGNITIERASINVTAVIQTTSSNDAIGIAILAGKDLFINNPRFISAVGTTSSFGYYEDAGLHIESLEDGYSILNATNPLISIGYDAFSDSNNWVEKIFWEGEEWETPYQISQYSAVLITTPTAITLDPNGGEGTTPAITAYYGIKTLNTSISAPVRDEYIFGGWNDKKTGGVTVIDTAGSLVPDVEGYTDTDGNWNYTKTEPLTLYAKWTAIPEPTGTNIKVTFERNGVTDPVTLKLTEVGETETEEYPAGTSTTYLIKDVNPGVYSLVASYTYASVEHDLTKSVTVQPGETAKVTFKLQTKAVTTEVETDSDPWAETPKIAVDGLDTVAAGQQVAPGQKVTISFTATGESDTDTDEQKALKLALVNKDGTSTFMDFSLNNVSTSAGGEEVTPITDAGIVLTIYVEYDMDFDTLEVVRLHDDEVVNFKQLSEKPTTPEDGTFFCGPSGIYIYTRYFSNYLISSTKKVESSNRGHSASIPKDYTPSSSVPVMVQETAQPTTAPTLAAPTMMPTTKPTTQATQKSPAPFAGLVLGFGAAALLIRMRR